MKEASKVEVVTLVILSCYDAIAGQLPAGMFEHVVARLKTKVWDDTVEFQKAAKLAAEEFLLERDLGAGDDSN